MSRPQKNKGKGKSPSINNKLSEDMVRNRLCRKIKLKTLSTFMTLKKLE